MKTTKQHFELFKKECQKWIEFFGLKDWDVWCVHENVEGNLGSIVYDLLDKQATINLATDWGMTKPTTLEIRKTAFHEVCELLLARLGIYGKARFIKEVDFTEATHDIIRRLENSVFK